MRADPNPEASGAVHDRPASVVGVEFAVAGTAEGAEADAGTGMAEVTGVLG